MPPRKGPRPHHVRIIRYATPDGRRCKRDTPGAVRSVETSSTYFGHVPDPGGGRPLRVSLGTTDLGQAWVELRRLLREAVEREAGIVHPGVEQARRPLAEHLEEWLAEVAAGGASAERVKLLRGRMQALVAQAGWKRLGDLTGESCVRALAALQGQRVRGMSAGYEGRSAQTRNHYLSHARQFGKWLADEGRIARNPFARLRPVSVETDRRHDRRSPSDAEVALLFEYLARPGCPRRRGMSGPCRALAYKVGMATGYRADELRSLSPASFDLEAGDVAVEAAYSKRRRRDVQPLPAWLVAELKAWLAAEGPLWERFPAHHPGQLLELDLAGAGIPYSVPGPAGQPLYFDFHALRHYYCTAVANTPGISPKTMLALCRHSDPRLTLRRYAKTLPDEARGVVDRLPRPGGKPVTGELREDPPA